MAPANQISFRPIKKILGWFGIVAFKRTSHSYMVEGAEYEAIALLAGRKDPVVIDGGAHKGAAVDQLARLLPGASFHCFEPDPELFEGLTAKFGGEPNVRVVAAALGDVCGTAMLNINASRPTNSLLATSAKMPDELKGLCQLSNQVSVEVTTLDDYVRSASLPRVDVVKLDLQGYDYTALRGAAETLRQARVVMVEILFSDIYRGAGTWSKIFALMADAGFDLHTLCNLQYGAGYKLLWADAVFVSRGAATPPLSPSATAETHNA